jgi:hypothetical protein
VTATDLELLEGGREYLARPDVDLFQGGTYFAVIGGGDEVVINDDRRCCGLGAVLAAAGSGTAKELGPKTFTRVVHLLEKALPAGSPTPRFINFNDHPSTSKADVLAVFDRAISDLRAGVTR